MSGADLKRAYKRIRDSENSAGKIASKRNRLFPASMKNMRKLEKGTSVIRFEKSCGWRIQDAVAHEKQMEEYSNAHKVLEEKVQGLESKLKT